MLKSCVVVSITLFLGLFYSCKDWSCDDTKTWGVTSRLSGVNLNILYRENTDTIFYPKTLNSGAPVNMKETDTIVFGFNKFWEKQSETKQCSDFQKEHSYLKMAGTRIRIKAVGDFDSTLKDGSDLSPYFISDNRFSMLDTRMYETEYGSAASVPSFWFSLIKQPMPGKHRFKFIMFTSQEDDGIQYITPEIEFIR